MSNFPTDKTATFNNGVSKRELKMVKKIIEQKIELSEFRIEKCKEAITPSSPEGLGYEHFDTRLTDVLADIDGMLKR